MTLLLVGLGWLLGSVLAVCGWSRWQAVQRAKARQLLLNRAVDRMIADAESRVTASLRVYQRTGANVYVPTPERMVMDRLPGDCN